jgi:putative pyruvate formate lyase activating enzyme
VDSAAKRAKVWRCSGNIAGTESIMRFLADEVSLDTYVNVMDQYFPAGGVAGSQFVEIDRRIRDSEHQKALEAARSAELWRVHQR